MFEINNDLSTNVPWKISRGTHNSCTLIFSSSMAAYSNWRMNIKLKEGNPSSVLTLAEGTGITVEDATHIKIEFTKEQSISLKKKEPYYYELIYDDGNGDTFALFRSDQFKVQNQNHSQPTGTTSVSVNTASNSLIVQVIVGGGGGSAEESKFTSNPTLVLPAGRSFGKYINGDTPNWIGLTAIEAILDAIIDYIAPVFSSFSISGQATTVEVGTTLSDNKTFLWVIVENSGEVTTIDIYDITAAANLTVNTPNDGSQAVTITSKQLNSNGATQQWRGVAHDDNTDNDINSNTFTVTARYYRFYGPAAAIPTNSAEVRALPSSAFQTGAGTFDFETGTDETKFIVAVPPGFVLDSAIDLDALNAPIAFELDDTVSVLDAGSTSRDYKVYAFETAIPYPSSHTIRVTIAAE